MSIEWLSCTDPVPEVLGIDIRNPSFFLQLVLMDQGKPTSFMVCWNWISLLLWDGDLGHQCVLIALQLNFVVGSTLFFAWILNVCCFYGRQLMLKESYATVWCRPFWSYILFGHALLWYVMWMNAEVHPNDSSGISIACPVTFYW